MIDFWTHLGQIVIARWSIFWRPPAKFWVRPCRLAPERGVQKGTRPPGLVWGCNFILAPARVTVAPPGKGNPAPRKYCSFLPPDFPGRKGHKLLLGITFCHERVETRDRRQTTRRSEGYRFRYLLAPNAHDSAPTTRAILNPFQSISLPKLFGEWEKGGTRVNRQGTGCRTIIPTGKFSPLGGRIPARAPVGISAWQSGHARSIL